MLVYELTPIQPEVQLRSQLILLYNILKFIETKFIEEKIYFDFSKTRFLHPLILLSLACLHNSKKQNCTIKFCNIINKDLEIYLKTTSFPEGIRPDINSSWDFDFEKYKNKNYLPIICFSTSRNGTCSEIRERALSKVNSLITTNFCLDLSYKEAITYVISEITDNIVEHSGEERGWLMVQFYPNMRFLDICIADTGKTILGSFNESGFTDIDQHIVALMKALEGLSTKYDKERGTGLISTKDIVINGMEGNLAIFSGNALFYGNNIHSLSVTWPGTLVAMRIQPNLKRLNIYNYLR